LQLLVLLMTMFEMVGVISITPFMALISDVSLLEHDGMLRQLYIISGASNSKDFIFLLGGFSLVALSISSVVSMFTVWNMAMFANRVGTGIGERLYSYYMTRSWLFHTEKNSAHLAKKISIESSRLTSSILVPLMQLNARIVLVIMMLSMIFWLNPIVAVSALIIFGLAYMLLFKIVRKNLSSNSAQITSANEERFLLMSEGFGGIKDILLLGRQADYIQRFKIESTKLAYCQGSNQGLVEVPRYFMELVTFSALISLILYLYSMNGNGISSILPLISVYALAGFKMLPAFQQIYRSVGQIKGNISAFYTIKEDLQEEEPMVTRNDEYLIPTKDIELRNVSFSYPKKHKLFIEQLNLLIPVRKTVGLIGSSGSGKSTVIDLLMGLIGPSEGALLIDGKRIHKHNYGAWQNIIGYVPQSIFLSDRTLLENIAFGIPLDSIDVSAVKKAITMAHLDELISELPDGLYSRMGERGVQFSGGQRQRVGIARALYHNPEVLVFDEATSALDGVTERIIMDAIHDFSGKKTIIMIAHRLKTVQECDIIFYMDSGRIVDQGTFSELIARNESFKKMASYS
jgi:ABC-type multidrug transport system fused ATPase/permease subunit